MMEYDIYGCDSLADFFSGFNRTLREHYHFTPKQVHVQCGPFIGKYKITIEKIETVKQSRKRQKEES